MVLNPSDGPGLKASVASTGHLKCNGHELHTEPAIPFLFYYVSETTMPIKTVSIEPRLTSPVDARCANVSSCCAAAAA